MGIIYACGALFKISGNTPMTTVWNVSYISYNDRIVCKSWDHKPTFDSRLGL